MKQMKQMKQMNRNRWQLYRAGLLNFWYYDEEDFYFADGKLLLRGNNGSGKSVTMQSFIPVLLDGRKSPDRLDPFGSRSRKMEDYLLGEPGLVDREDRTGYLYLEYKRRGVEQYLTTGIGLRARRRGSMDFWGFVLWDNRQIGKDLSLYKTEYSSEEGQDQKIPLTPQELENRIGQGGRVVRTQGEYMELVNKHIFGFASKDAYEELIKLLIQLRSPKLSKDFRPTVIYEILNESLPAISDAELKPLSDTIENMDQTKQQLEQILREQRSLKKLCSHYDRYNQFVLAEKAEGVIKSCGNLQKLRKHEEELGQGLTKYQEELTQLREDMVDRQREKEALTEESKVLKKHDVFVVEKEKISLENVITDLREQIQQKQKACEQKRSKEVNLRRSISGEEKQIYELEKEIVNFMESLADDAENCRFAAHETASREFEKNRLEEYHFDLWKKEADDYYQKFEEILKVLREESLVREKYRDLHRELGDARQELDMRRDEEKKCQDRFEEKREKLLICIHRWARESQELLLSREDIQLLSRCCSELYEGCSYEELREPVVKSYQQHYKEIEKKILEVEHQIKEKDRATEEKEAELKEWRQKKDPEPARHQDTAAAREQLKKSNIPWLPFFAAVEFKQQVAPEQRERIESAITQMGLLDALIVPEKYLDRAVVHHDRVIKPNPQVLAYTLTEFLFSTPVEGIEITAADINNVLSSIMVSDAREGVAGLKEDGTYHLSLIKGHAPRENSSIFIGKEARHQYRRQVIARLSEQLAELQVEHQSLQELKNSYLGQRQQLEKDFKRFPCDRGVKKAYHNLEELRRQVKVQLKEVDLKNDKLKELLAKWQEVKEKLRLLAEGMELQQGEEAYETGCRHMRSYLGRLQKLELTYKDYCNCQRMLKQFELSLSDLIKDVGELKRELNLLDDRLKVNVTCLQQVEQHLQDMGAVEIRLRINRVEKRLSLIPDEMLQLQEAVSNANNTIKNTELKIGSIEESVKAAREIYRLWGKVFQEELRLELVKEDKSEPLLDGAARDILKLARRIWQRYKSLVSDSDRDKVGDSLNRSFYQEQGVLVEYRPVMQPVFELKVSAPELESREEDEGTKAQIDQLERRSRRIQLLLEHGGKRVTPYYVLEQMNKDIDLQRMILSEKDRELYEEIIMNTVGRIIRGRINRAEQWVKKIDELMGQRDTSSGLTFSLRWRPRTAEHEEEMDTKDLLELLRLDPRLLKEQDMQQVTRHFRSKIERAKEVLTEKGYGETLHQVIKEMLDYRQWFSFTLYYRRTGEQKKELTNNVFYRFSGGEKAMSMYIPLFSAAYSRYLEARQDAPFIISLDEAFAGVDENNIRDMFDLMEELGFNYFINSQSLWGDYDTVSALSICELVRPLNRPYVSVVHYYWNGKIRRLLAGTGEHKMQTEKGNTEVVSGIKTAAYETS